MDIAVAAWRAMAEDGYLFVDTRLPCPVLDLDAAVANLELKSARGERVKAKHPIVWVLSEAFHEADALIEGAIMDSAKIFESPGLQHEMIDALWKPLAERDGMVARVCMEEDDVHLRSIQQLALDLIA